MKKLIIKTRTNWEKKFYLKVKATDDSIKIIKKIFKDFGDDYFIDMQGQIKGLTYEKWKDQWIPLITKKVSADIICGCKFIHFIFYNLKNFDYVNKIIDKYMEWENEN